MDETLRQLYLDLLIATLTNTIYGDPSIHPSNAGTFRPGVREQGMDWPAVAHTMVGTRRMRNLRELSQRAIDERVPGNFIETGVWRGGCCILMRGVLKANGVTDRKVFVADSFAGLPPPNVAKYPQDAPFDLSGYQDLAVSVDEVKANFAKYGLLDEQVVFVPGFFQQTLAPLDTGPLALMRLDGDLYESTIVALEALYPRLSPGGFVIIDDYGLIEPCKQAVHDYRDRMKVSAPIVPIDASGVWWQK